MSVSNRCTSVGEQEKNLMNRFRAQTPEVPSHVRVMLVSLRVSLLAVNKIREFDRVSDEEDRSIVTNNIIVALFCVKFQSETSRIPSNIRETFLSSDCGEPQEAGSLLAYTVKELSLSIPIVKGLRKVRSCTL